MLKLRYYQEDAVQNFMDYTASNHGKNPLIVMPTGSGKSLIIATIIKQVMEYPGTRVLVLTHQKELITQNMNEFLTLTKNDCAMDVGVYSAGLKSRDTEHRILFAGIQSIHKRAYELGLFDLVLIDECHRVPINSEGTYRRFLADVKKINEKCVIAGLSATCYRLKGGLLCDESHKERIFHAVCHETTMPELMRADHFRNRDKVQYLCPLVSKNSKNSADMTGIHKTGGEYNLKEMEEAFDKDDLVTAAVNEIKKLASGRNKILVFTTGIKHCESVSRKMSESGFTTEHIHSNRFEWENETAIQNFKDGKIQALVNVDILCLDEETEILTSSGFVGIDEMTMNHNVAAWKENSFVEFTKPLTIVKRQRLKDEKMVSFGNDRGYSAGIRVTANHRMVIRNGRNNSKIKVVSAEECAKLHNITIPAFGDTISELIYAETPKHKQSIEVNISSISFLYRKRGYSKEESLKLATNQVNKIRSKKYKNPFELTLDECFIIGVWLGDGTKSNGRVSICQSMAYNDNIHQIEQMLNMTKIHYHKQEYKAGKKSKHKSVRWTLARGTGGFNQSIDHGYFEIEPYLNKNGSPLYWGLNRVQLEFMLKGFFLADGLHHSKNKTKRKQITGTQKQLYDLLQAICSVRGISATISKCSKPKNIKHKQQYRFTYGARENWVYTGNKNIKIEQKYKKERVWCVTSTTSYLICRRRGKVFVTGNTTGFNEKAIDCIAMLRATMSAGLYVQIAGRGCRMHESKQDCLFLDFGGNILRHGAIDKIEIKMNKEGRSEVSTQPMKPCPVCAAAMPISAKQCPECGYIYPEEEPNHEKTASEAEIISTWKKPEWYDITSVFYSKHEKPGKTTSLRVDYYYGKYNQYFSEWVCVEHSGFAREKAFKWLEKRLEHVEGEINIQNVDDALQCQHLFLSPKQISVDLNEHFPRIKGYIF